jgi:AraC-like DNA-binding protein
VAHTPESELTDLPGREDRPVGRWRHGVVAGDLSAAPAVYHLAEHIVTRYQQSLHDHGPPSHTRHEYSSSTADIDAAEMRLLGRLLVAQIARVLQNPAAMREHHSPAMDRLLVYIHEHLDQPLDLETLASQAHCSRATLLRMFRGELNVSPGRWLTQLRVRQAQVLLRSTAEPVHEIARRVGLPDAHYFSHVFRKTAGMTPSAYRRTALPL